MLIDDKEGVVCLLFTEVFQALGYQILPFQGMYDALTYYRENYAKIDYVVLSATNGPVDGHEIYSSLSQINPNVEAVVSHDEKVAQVSRNVLSLAPIVFVHKPRFAANLFEKMREIFAVDRQRESVTETEHRARHQGISLLRCLF